MMNMKGYRKRHDYPQLGVATYYVCSHGGCALCLRLFAYLSLLTPRGSSFNAPVPDPIPIFQTEGIHLFLNLLILSLLFIFGV